MSITQVKTLPLLQGLPQPLLDEYSRYFRMFRIEKKHFVCHKGDEANELFFLLSGRLMVVDISLEGRQTGLNFIAPGDYFGELSVLDDLPRPLLRFQSPSSRPYPKARSTAWSTMFQRLPSAC